VGSKLFPNIKDSTTEEKLHVLRLLIQYRKGNGNSFALVGGGHRIMAILSLIYKFKKTANPPFTTTTQSVICGIVNTKDLCRKASLYMYVPIFKMTSDESRMVDKQKRLTRFSICQFFNTLSSAIQSQSTSAQKLSMKQLLSNVIGTTNMIGIGSDSISDSNSSSDTDSLGDNGGMTGVVSYDENYPDIGIENAVVTACYISFRAEECDSDIDQQRKTNAGSIIRDNIYKMRHRPKHLVSLALQVREHFLKCDDKTLKSKLVTVCD
jgi:hypothetical protein